MKIIAYPTQSDPPKLVQASPKREWMDVATNKNPYRCLPLSMANGWGWQLLSQGHFIAEWNGGKFGKDITITRISGTGIPSSHFGEGTLTWHLGYVFKTEYPYGIYMTGAPNNPKPNAIALSGLVETHWLPYTATMNWRFTHPGRFEMRIGEPFCQLFPVDMTMFQNVMPEIRSMSEPEAKEFHDLYWEWNLSRSNFMMEHRNGLHTASDWQKNYFQGTHPPDGTRKCPVHITTDGKEESNHLTKPGVPPFKENITVPFITPDFYWKRIGEISDREQELMNQRQAANTGACQQAVVVQEPPKPQPTLAIPVKVNSSFEMKSAKYEEYLRTIVDQKKKTKTTKRTTRRK